MLEIWTPAIENKVSSTPSDRLVLHFPKFLEVKVAVGDTTCALDAFVDDYLGAV